MSFFWKHVRQAWLVHTLPKEVRAVVTSIELRFAVLKSEKRASEDYSDCTYVLETCQAWIEKLEECDVPDDLPLLEELRKYMYYYLPLYVIVMRESIQNQSSYPKLDMAAET